MYDVQLVTVKYLNNNSQTFLIVKKTNSTSNTWKHILNHKKLLRKGLSLVLGDGEYIIFWYMISLMSQHLLIKLILTLNSMLIIKLEFNFISPTKKWNI